MNARHVRLLSEEVYQFAFQLLDSEPEMDGNEAGKVANSLQKTFENALIEPEYRKTQLTEQAMTDRVRASIIPACVESGEDE